MIRPVDRKCFGAAHGCPLVELLSPSQAGAALPQGAASECKTLAQCRVVNKADFPENSPVAPVLSVRRELRQTLICRVSVAVHNDMRFV